MITALTVNYNTPEYLKRLLTSFRKFYPDMPCVVVDGSSKEYYRPIKNFDKRFNVIMYNFNYNVHHGPGMAFGIGQIATDRILLMDSDIIFTGGGIIEKMDKELPPTAYGIGDIQKEQYLDSRKRPIYIDYLHPAFALINRKVAIKYKLPMLNGAPLIGAMIEIDGNSKLIKLSKEVQRDFWKHKSKYIQHNEDHNGMGTVIKTGGYHY